MSGAAVCDDREAWTGKGVLPAKRLRLRLRLRLRMRHALEVMPE